MPRKFVGRNFKKLKFLLLFFVIFFYSSSGFSASKSSSIESVGGLEVTDEKNDNLSLQLHGNLQLDDTSFSGSYFDKQQDLPSGSLIRIAYLILTGGLYKNWTYDVIISYQEQEATSVKTVLRDAHLNYLGIEDSIIQFGQIPVPSSLENFTNNVEYVFLEPSLLTETFFPVDDYGPGIYLTRKFQDKFTLTLAAYRPTPGAVNIPTRFNSDIWGEAFRMTYAPIHTQHELYHFGFWYRHQDLIAFEHGELVAPHTSFVGFAGFPEAQSRNTIALIETGPIRATSFDMAGIEYASFCGPWFVQGEYLRVIVHPKDFEFEDLPIVGNLRFWGAYLQAGYVLTGESPRYEFYSGTMIRVKPEHDYGAWVIAVRYSQVSLISKTLYGGREGNASFGVNWYANDQVRIAANYIRAHIRPSILITPFAPELPPRCLDIFAIRFQVVF